MKQLVCEMCGSTDLVKQDGVFVCQSCGVKYSVEEARKMMIEGPVDVSGSVVKVDTSEKLQNILTLARRAREEDNAADARKYYELALLEVPDDWEANFYFAYYRLMESPIADTRTGMANFSRRFLTALNFLLPASRTDPGRRQMEDMFMTVRELFSRAVTYFANREEELVKGMGAELLSMVLGGKTGGSNPTQEELQQLLSASALMRDAITGAFDLLRAKGISTQIAPLQDLLPICEQLYAMEVKRIFFMPDPLAYARGMLHYSLLADKPDAPCIMELQNAVTELLNALKNVSSAFPTVNMQSTISNCQQILHLIEDHRKAALPLYWEKHPEELAELKSKKEALLAELAQLDAQLAQLRLANQNDPLRAELADVQALISRLTAERAALGLFKVKEKKQLQDRIDAAAQQQTDLRRKLNLQAATADQSRAALCSRQSALRDQAAAIDKKLGL